jgi:hypothetical protein
LGKKEKRKKNMLHSPGQETFKHTGQMTNIEFVVEINGGLFKIVAHTIVQIQSGIDNVDTHAALLYKTGNYNQALKKAKEAIDITQVTN